MTPRWKVRKRLWEGYPAWIAYERVDLGADRPPLWNHRCVSASWDVVMRFVEVRVRGAWEWGDHHTPVEPPAAAR